MKLEEKDLVEEFSRSGGRGGQNVQKVETKVVLRHIPTGVTVVAQEERFREANRIRARKRMVAALIERERRIRLAKAAERSKERSRKAKRSWGATRELVEGKRQRAKIKVGRGKMAGGGVSSWLYVLECGDGSLYTGWTNRLEKRLLAHEKGVGGKYTRSRLPVRLVAAWRKRSEKEARSAEVYFKQLSRGEKMDRVGRAPKKSLPTRVRARVGKRSAN